MSDLEIVACLSRRKYGDRIGELSEDQLFSILKTDCANEFPNLLHWTTYNRRRRKLKSYIFKVVQQLSQAVMFSSHLTY